MKAILEKAPSVTVAESHDHLLEIACNGQDREFEVAYDLPDGRTFVEARVAKVRNGLLANYTEAYMRRRDPECMVIADERPTNKATWKQRFGTDFEPTRQETFEWLASQDVLVLLFRAGQGASARPAVAIGPKNAGFFIFGLSLLQGLTPPEDVTDEFVPAAVIYVAPPFRHTHFDGKQVVVHNRTESFHELFSYNLYPGPSAKKGVYGVLLTVGEQEGWLTAHCSTVQVVTPYDNVFCIMHEGASGGGKSEMLEQVQRQEDGRLLVAESLVDGEKLKLALPRACALRPVTDDMALCHPSIQDESGKLVVEDAENAWFLRVNHITEYGTDPHLEKLTLSPSKPLLFLNLDAVPGARVPIWDHIYDAPGVPCPNPRVVVPRSIVPDVVNGPVTVDLRTFGVRTPPCTKERPSYGIIGLFHVLPPALAWLWRMTAPRGHANPSIVDTKGMTSEGVGSYWPFATGRRVDQANLILKQIVDTPAVRYRLVPNQHIGAYKVGFMPQWLAREYFARRGNAPVRPGQLISARCNLLGWTPTQISIEGTTLPDWLLRVDQQLPVGTEAYDIGAKELTDFFQRELELLRNEPDLDPLGKKIIEACYDDATVEQYAEFIDQS
ncbi:MAG: DUF4914 family protein [Phycisphaerae bacterium]